MESVLLVSGSKGSRRLIEHKGVKPVTDCGTTRKYLENCSEQISYDPMQSNTLLITHAHNDHIAQMKLSDPMPTYVTRDVITSRLHTIHPYNRLELQNFRIAVLPMGYDCEGAAGYVIKIGSEKTVCVTDTGYIKDEAKEHIHNVDYYVFESSHDTEMLVQATGPIYLEQRIIDDCGHLCNEDYLNVLYNVMGGYTKEVVFAHISQEGNAWGMALTTLKETLKREQKDHEDLCLYLTDQLSIYTGGKSP